MTSEEIELYLCLKAQPEQFSTALAVSRRVAKRRARYDPQWALPVLGQLADRGILESDGNSAFRIKASLLDQIEAERQKQKWLAPHIRRIFETSRQDLSKAITLDDPERKILLSL